MSQFQRSKHKFSSHPKTLELTGKCGVNYLSTPGWKLKYVRKRTPVVTVDAPDCYIIVVCPDGLWENVSTVQLSKVCDILIALPHLLSKPSSPDDCNSQYISEADRSFHITVGVVKTCPLGHLFGPSIYMNHRNVTSGTFASGANRNTCVLFFYPMSLLLTWINFKYQHTYVITSIIKCRMTLIIHPKLCNRWSLAMD